jgi:hypothetical protein
MPLFTRHRWKGLLTSAIAALLSFVLGAFVWIYNDRYWNVDHATGVSLTLWPVVGLAVVVFAVTWCISKRS